MGLEREAKRALRLWSKGLRGSTVFWPDACWAPGVTQACLAQVMPSRYSSELPSRCTLR